MSESSERFEQLLREARAGSAAASRELLEEYGDYVRRVVRSRLLPRMRSQFDSIDFQQAVWASFFVGPLNRLEFRTPDDLIGYLVQMANNKVGEATQAAFGTQKRDLRRERYLEDVGEENPAVLRKADATPSQLAVARESLERMKVGKPPSVCRMIDMLSQGFDYADVTGATGIHAKAIQRRVRKLREELE